MPKSITTLDELEAVIGKVSALMRLKSIDHLDEGALRWIASSPLMFAGFGDGSNISITLGGGEPGWAGGHARELRLPMAMLDEPTLARPGIGFGSIFMLPAIREVMRVNGTVARVHGSEMAVTVEECYFHCGKALIRSEFWAASPSKVAPGDVAAFVHASRFMALATVNAQGQTDVSPKGDRAGTMACLHDGLVWYCDRPGNKRIDSFRNIITQPRVAAALLIPGSSRFVFMSGTARITTDEAMRAEFTVEGKTPALVTSIDELQIESRASSALARVPLWPVTGPPQDIDPTKMALAHVKLSKSMGAQVAATALSIPGLMQKGVEHEYKKNLF